MTEDIPNDTLLFSRLWTFLTVKLFYYFQEIKLSFLLVRYSTILWRIYRGLFEWYSTIYGGVIEDILNSLSASLLLNIFLSFEVGIAHAIANFK